MHELAIAQSLLDIVLEEAARHGVAQVARVGVKIGAFTNVVADSLTFCFDLIKEGTAASGAELVITPVPLAGDCADCGAAVVLADPFSPCPECGSAKVRLNQGQELCVDYIESAEPAEAAAPTGPDQPANPGPIR